MTIGKWILGAVAAGLALGAAGARAAAMPLVAADGPAPVQNVQFYYEEYYYDGGPPRHYRQYYGPPPRYYEPPRYYSPPPPPARYPVPPHYSYWDKEAAKDHMKAYRRAQKEIYKERARAWNRANGY